MSQERLTTEEYSLPMLIIIFFLVARSNKTCRHFSLFKYIPISYSILDQNAKDFKLIFVKWNIMSLQWQLHQAIATMSPTTCRTFQFFLQCCQLWKGSARSKWLGNDLVTGKHLTRCLPGTPRFVTNVPLQQYGTHISLAAALFIFAAHILAMCFMCMHLGQVFPKVTEKKNTEIFF